MTFTNVRDEVLTAYAKQPWLVRYHLRGRFALCPFEKILAHIPTKGTLLDFGCGYGLFSQLVKLTRPELNVYAYDPSSFKRAVAQQSLGGRAIRFLESESFFESGLRVDCIGVIDVFYLLNPVEKENLIRRCVGILNPGGTILIKENDRRPRLKFYWAYAEESLAVRILKFTQGNGLFYEDSENAVARFKRYGLGTEVIPLHEGYMYPHYLLKGTKLA